MRTVKGFPVAAAIFAGAAGAVLTVGPALAGDTARSHGCAAHWRTTAAWNECVNTRGVNIRLQVDCAIPELDYAGPWKRVVGSSDPVDRNECLRKANSAWNGFK